MRRTTAAAASVITGLVVLAVLPMLSFGSGLDALTGKLRATLEQVTGVVAPEATPTPTPTPTPEPTAGIAQAEDPKTQPPLHGTTPHGQGTVAVIDLTPSTTRPTGSDPAGSDTGEEIVVGRAKGEQAADGSYRGHITIVGLLGSEVLGVDTTEGQTVAGPLDAVQEGLLTPLCNGTANNVCLSAVTADSSTSGNASANRFSTAHATLGGASGIDVGAAESRGDIGDDGTCQAAHSESHVANASVGGQAVASALNSQTDSRACKGQAPAQTNSSSVIGLGGVGVPLPAAGCADGTADTLTGIPVLAPIVCNADDTNTTQAATPYGVRDALDVFLLDAGGTTAALAGTAQSESRAQAPPAQCSNGGDDDGDGAVDAADPGCHTDGNPSNPATYDPNDDSELDDGGGTQCSNGTDDDGDGVVDAADPGCHTDGDPDNPASYDPDDDSEAGGGTRGDDDDGGGDRRPQCSNNDDDDGDGRVDEDDPGCHSDGNPDNPDSYNPNDDNERDGGEAGGPGGGTQCSNGGDDDGDGLIDAADPGCHTDGDASNPDSYDPGDDSEADAARRLSGAGLPRTGSDVVLLLIAGVLMLGGGAELRRRTRLG